MPPRLSDDELNQRLGATVDADWYKARYPDVAAAADLDPIRHFIRFGAAENRDPNRFFDSAWYLEHYPDVASGGYSALQHYLQAGGAELRNPHPRFDARYYVERHPEAAENPLLYHLQTGVANGYLTEHPIDIRDYLPVEKPAPLSPSPAFVDVIVPVCDGLEQSRRCILSVLADRTYPLARVTVIDDACADTDPPWLRELAAEGQINLVRNQRKRGSAACINAGIAAADPHDVVVLNSETEVPTGWLQRLGALAWSDSRIATASPIPDLPALGPTPTALDEICRTVNAGRSAPIPLPATFCLYIRRDALRAVGAPGNEEPTIDFCRRASIAGWQHRLACDTFVSHGGAAIPDRNADPFRFAVAAAAFRRSGLPVILMVSHDMGGGVRRHIESLADQCRGRAHILLLEGTDRGAGLSLADDLHHPVLRLPSDRLDDMVRVLRSANVTRVHVHHLLHMDMDIRRLIHSLGVPFDVTVHDYYAICPQVNLLRWPEAIHCGEPGPADCNACIADLSAHGARDILSWRHERAWQFTLAERVICPSEDVRTRLARYGVRENAIVVPHEATPPGDWPIRAAPRSAPPLRVALLGVLANQKGARIVASVAEAADKRTLEIHLIGHVEPSFPEPATKLIKATGAYRDADLEVLVRDTRPHVFWFPSTAAETYSYTLSTAIATGLPIVATKLGSFPERLEGRPNTWLVDHRATTAGYLAVFAEVQASLRHAIPPPVRRPATASDFYKLHYLAPKVTATRKQRPRIVVVPERQGNGLPSPCAYIRLLQPLDHPAIGADFEIVLSDLASVFDTPADVIATQRHAIPDAATADKLAEHARRVGARLLYDLDDDLLGVPANHPDAVELRPQAKGVRRMLTVADEVWVSTQGLADRLSAIRPDASVIENRLDERIWFAPQAPALHWDHPVRILCMGTTSHERDFALVEPVLTRLKGDYGDQIVIDILGMTPRKLASGLNRIGPSRHASRSYPGFVNWLNRVQPGWHIGLAPLLDTAFNRCKSPIKVMDYAAIGLATLASDVPTYRGSIVDGPAGQLVSNNAAAWHAALDWLIRDQAPRRAMAERARQAFAARGTLASAAEQRLAAWKSLLQPSTRLRGGSPALTITHDQTHSAPRTRRHSGRRR